MSPNRLIRSAWSLFLMMVIAAPVLAADPMEEIKQTTDKILSIIIHPVLKVPSEAAARARLIRRALDERFDWGEMARRSLATHWAERTAEERTEFAGLLADLMERTYVKKVEDYSGEKILYEGGTEGGDYATVRVKIVTKKNKDVPVEYRLKREGTGWLIYDASIEAVSLVNNFRTQFNSIILQSSYENLVKKLRDKVEIEGRLQWIGLFTKRERSDLLLSESR